MNFLRSVRSMVIGRIATVVLAIAINALSARLLTPSQLGSLAATIAGIALCVRMASIGLGQAAQFFGAREGGEKRCFSLALMGAAAPIAVIGLVGVIFAGPLLGRMVLPGDPEARKIFEVLKFGIPLTFVHFVGSLYILGRREMGLYLAMTILPVAASVLVLLGGALSNQGLGVVLVAWTAQFILAFLLGIFAFLATALRSEFALKAALLPIYDYGRKSYVVSLAAFAAGNIGLLMGAWFTLSNETGRFAVGKTFAEALLLPYGAVGPLIFSHVGRIEDTEACHIFIGRACRLSFLLFSVIAFCIAAIAPIGMRWIFGGQYSQNYVVVWLLLPGLVFSALQRILENYLYGRAKQAPLIFVHLISIGLLIGGSSLLVPRYGALGLGIASTVSFLGSFVATAVLALRIDGLDPFRLLFPYPADIRLLLMRLGVERG